VCFDLVAEALKITAVDLLSLKVIDAVIPELLDGAHRRPEEAIALVGNAIAQQLDVLGKLPIDELLAIAFGTNFDRGTCASRFFPSPWQGESQDKGYRQ
jgi:acetyl-CoA carboxylase alpha subunit